jgi:hypothetical protein
MIPRVLNGRPSKTTKESQNFEDYEASYRGRDGIEVERGGAERLEGRGRGVTTIFATQKITRMIIIQDGDDKEGKEMLKRIITTFYPKSTDVRANKASTR